MPLLTERHLLDLWERGLATSTLARAEALLSVASPEGESADPAGLPIGERERRLLRLRARLFGPRMNGLAACPACGERHDIAFHVEDLLSGFSDRLPAPVTVQSGEWQVTARPITCGDLRSAARAADSAAALLALCVVAVRRGDTDADADDLPDDVRAAIGEALSAADPLADLAVDLTCAACAHTWSAPLDAAAWLWSELQAWARRLLLDVHGLARAYGWSEDEVLKLSPWRRAAYLSMAG